MIPMRRNGWTPGRANRILTCCGSGMPLLLWERPGAGGMKPQHSRQRMIHNLPQRIYRSRRIFPYRNIRKAGIWIMSRPGHLKHRTIWNRELLHRNRTGGISDMKIPGVRILTAAILVQNATHRENPVRQNAVPGCTSTAISTNSVSRRRPKPRNQRRNHRRQPKGNRNGLPSWNLPLTNSHQKQRIRNSPRPDGKQNGQRKSWNRQKTACLPAISCGWKHLLTLIRVRQKNA